MVNIIDQNHKVLLHLHQDSSHRHRGELVRLSRNGNIHTWLVKLKSTLTRWRTRWQTLQKLKPELCYVLAQPSPSPAPAKLLYNLALPSLAKQLYVPALPLPGSVQMNQKQRPGQTSACPCSHQSRGRSPQVSTDKRVSKSNAVHTDNGRSHNL